MSTRFARRHQKLEPFGKHIDCPQCSMSMRITARGGEYTVMYECSQGHHQAMYRGRYGLTTEV